MLTVETLDEFLKETDASLSADIAWAAGLFEGEGCIYKRTYKYKRKKSVREGTCTSVYLSLDMTDKDVVEKFRDIIGAGTVRIKSKYRADRKDQYRCQVGKKEDINRIITLFWPYLGDRRKQKTVELGINP